MITTLYAISLAGILLLPVLLLFMLDRKFQRRERRQLRSHLEEAAIASGLRYSGLEILNDLAIGLDGTSRKLVLVEKMHGSNYYSTIINLGGMEACTTWKQYTTVSRQEGFVEKKAGGVKSIVLMLHLGGKTTVEIPFYRSYQNKAGDRPVLEKKARQWEGILLKMITPFEKRA